MSGFHIHSGNRLESLAEVLAGLVSSPGRAGIFEPEVVVVPSRGLERWLKLYLARVNGIAANLEFPFPQAFLEQNVFAGLRRQIKDEAHGDSFTKELLVWKLFLALGEDTSGAESGRADFGAVAGYLEQTGDELSRYQLALALGDLFDRYLLFRPELIRAWERGENPLSQFPASAWQMALWRQLGQGVAKTHFAALQEIVNQMVYPEFFPAASEFSLAGLKAKLPPRLFLFGFAALPFNYLDLFKALSRLTEVHLFHVNPCAEFWGDQFRSDPVKYTHKDESGGHPLLASWGRLGRAFFDLSASLESDSYREYFVVPESDTLLAALQRQILYLQPPAQPLTCSAADSSLKINLCHGRQREIEIIHDTILDALAKDPDLRPDDILVMAPDISIYTPYIEALFARQRQRSGAVALDYLVVSSKSILNLPEIKAFFDLLRLVGSRFFLREVFDLFSQEVVRRRFSVSESGLDLLAEWLRRAAVNWGLDSDFRQDVSDVGFAENSLFWGLDRLLTGYALAGGELYDVGAGAGAVWLDEEGCGLQPLAGIEGSEALIFGSFMRFADKLRQTYKRLSQPLPAARWRSELEPLLDDFILSRIDDDSGGLRLRQAFSQLDKYLQAVTDTTLEEKCDRNAGDYRGGVISCETILLALERELESGNSDRGFFSGGITFSSILPLRAVPARMICLIGLNDGDFPRSQRPSAYDLIAARPRAGDRNARDEDRYLFLETLLAARQTLVLSYLGRDPKDNHPRPPAVVVSELIDYIEDNFTPAPASNCRTMRDFLLCDHPPQPFSPRYFATGAAVGRVDPARLFSYDKLQAEIATRINAGVKAKPDFFAKPLPDLCIDRVDFADLVKFFSNPVKLFLKERLKIVPGIRELDHFADSEPFALDGLATYNFNDELVSHFLAADLNEVDTENEIRELDRRFAASGTLPPLAPGRSVFADRVKAARAMAEQLKPYCARRQPARRQEVTIPLSGREVVVAISLTNLFAGRDGWLRQILFRPAADLKNRDRVKMALMNLGLEIAAALESDSEPESQAGAELISAPLETRFHTLKEKNCASLPVGSAAPARTDLKTVLQIYFAGLRQPLAFLPELSLLWYSVWLKESAKNGAAAARDRVRNELTNERNYAARDEDFHYVFGDRFEDEDFWREFAELATSLGPLFMPAAGE